MHEEELKRYEGNIVYCFHRVHKDQEPTRGTRGIIHKGRCYDIQVVAEGRPPLPVVYLPLIETGNIAYLQPLSQEQCFPLERMIAETLRTTDALTIKAKFPLKVGESPKEYTGQRITEKEKKEEPIPMRTGELPLHLS